MKERILQHKANNKKPVATLTKHTTITTLQKQVPYCKSLLPFKAINASQNCRFETFVLRYKWVAYLYMGHFFYIARKSKSEKVLWRYNPVDEINALKK